MGFEKIMGQKRAKSVLKSAVKFKRISHAYLFYGPRGVGKSMAALAFAQALNCLSLRDGGEPCGVCASCLKIAGGNHPDVSRITPEGSSLKIKQIRDMQEKAYYKCYEGKIKVIIIYEAHLLTPEAANSLLRILEEPPGDTVFLLLVEDTQRLPDTIISRCRGVSFSPLADEAVKGILEEKGISIQVPLSLAYGSVQKAIDLNEDSSCRELVKETEEFLAKIQNHGYRELFSYAEHIEQKKGKITLLLDYFDIVFRNRMLRLVAHDKGGGSETETSAGEAFGYQACREALEEIGKTYYYLYNNANTRLALENLFIKLKKLSQRGG